MRRQNERPISLTGVCLLADYQTQSSHSPHNVTRTFNLASPCGVSSFRSSVRSALSPPVVVVVIVQQ